MGTFDTQRNSFRPFNDRQDVEAFVNFKPFYNEEEGFLLRDLQFGGSVPTGSGLRGGSSGERRGAPGC